MARQFGPGRPPAARLTTSDHSHSFFAGLDWSVGQPVMFADPATPSGVRSET